MPQNVEFSDRYIDGIATNCYATFLWSFCDTRVDRNCTHSYMCKKIFSGTEMYNSHSAFWCRSSHKLVRNWHYHLSNNADIFCFVVRTQILVPTLRPRLTWAGLLSCACFCLRRATITADCAYCAVWKSESSPIVDLSIGTGARKLGDRPPLLSARPSVSSPSAACYRDISSVKIIILYGDRGTRVRSTNLPTVILYL